MASAAKKVLVPVANGTEPLEAVITIDVLRRAGADVTVASVEKQLCVDACHGVKIVADALISDCADTAFDLISLPPVYSGSFVCGGFLISTFTLPDDHVLVNFDEENFKAVVLNDLFLSSFHILLTEIFVNGKGGMPGAATFKDCNTLESIVKKQAENDRPYAAICAAPAVALGSWGLLKGLKATCNPSFMDQLSSSASSVESRVQQDGKVVTSRGPGTAMEYSVALVELLYGKEKADEVSGPLDQDRDMCDVIASNAKRHEIKSREEYTFTELNPVKWTFDSSPQVDENVLSDHDYMDYVVGLNQFTTESLEMRDNLSSPPCQILVPIADGTEEMEAVIIIDVLRRAKAEVVVASVEDKLEILASRKVKLVADVLLDEAANRSYDLIVLPGGLGGAQTFANSEKLVNLLKKQRESNKLYGAICASPALVLEAHGLLKGKKATAFPAMCNKLSDPSEAENRVVVDGNLVTSRGPGTTMEFSLVIVEKLFGRQKALDLAKTMLFVQ
ncbi:protein DJ-1B [Sesamum angolense]|uniref:Protein DJ-1B n=1 Tax=Sesamum angolense TaxID=2727404 RepID=A0AAE2BIY5_9LAMI|nr:protein DJ-1B [Sesamum angolense]